MDTDKAYLLGLIIGGAFLGILKMDLGLNYHIKWGSYISNPERAGKIAEYFAKGRANVSRDIWFVCSI